MIFPSFDKEKALFASQSSILLAGVDEAGRGPLAGPLVVGMVVLDQTHIPIDGVRDSKTLNETQREKLFTVITSQALTWSYGMCSHTEIDNIGIMDATKTAVMRAYNEVVYKGRRPSTTLIDGKFLHGFPFVHSSYDKGDRDIYIISAASIIAKVIRDRMMREIDPQFPQYGFAKHKGYGTRYHFEMIREHGLCEIHRRSFCRGIVG